MADPDETERAAPQEPPSIPRAILVYDIFERAPNQFVVIDRTHCTAVIQYVLTTSSILGDGQSRWNLHLETPMITHPSVSKHFKHSASLGRLLMVRERVTRIETRNVFTPFKIRFDANNMYRSSHPWGRVDKDGTVCIPTVHFFPTFKYPFQTASMLTTQDTCAYGVDGLLYQKPTVDIQKAFSHSQVDIIQELERGIVGNVSNESRVGIDPKSVLGQMLFANESSKDNFGLNEKDKTYDIGCNGVLQFIQWWSEQQCTHTSDIIFDRRSPAATMELCPVTYGNPGEGMLAFSRLPALLNEQREAVEFPKSGMQHGNVDDAKTQYGYQDWSVKVFMETQIILPDIYYASIEQANPYVPETPLQEPYVPPGNKVILQHMVAQQAIVRGYTSKDAVLEFASIIINDGGMPPQVPAPTTSLLDASTMGITLAHENLVAQMGSSHPRVSESEHAASVRDDMFSVASGVWKDDGTPSIAPSAYAPSTLNVDVSATNPMAAYRAEQAHKRMLEVESEVQSLAPDDVWKPGPADDNASLFM